VATYFLSPHTQVCELQEGAIILDLKHHRYHGVAARHVPTLRNNVRDWPNAAQHTEATEREHQEYINSVLFSLFSTELLSTVASQGRLSRQFAPPVEASIDHEQLIRTRTAIRLKHVAAFTFAVVFAGLLFKLSNMEDIVRRIERRRGAAGISPAGCDHATLCDLVLVFRRLSAWTYTAKDACLFDSLALYEFLYRLGIMTTWVIGVRAKPFTAHCWVQHGSLVLNDTITHAQDFTVILAV
jgi:hypothetical protein